ncbi:AUGMIN subunit 8 [Sesamum indicum]|uniref:AUGMIN subunit 8 n=1 Tax=Sesamum indicum TaxID=4182 RepID=A0A6I9TII7_SESIN|nr:AUGMIN subunit 8 [Sesamum indicum]XP_011083937.1 AUGMIN subunit 8 [Sesamum indicum]XP_011083939.1 AUGMIN subunit 8 [Sesamum indicum]
MDVCQSEKRVERQSRPEARVLVSADNKNGTTCRSHTREVSSRYRSPTPSAGGRRRSPSPIASRTSSASTVSVPNKAISTETKRPSTLSLLPSPSPSTPVQDTTAEMLLAARARRLSPSPIGRRTSSTPTVSVPKRAISTERKRPSTPSVPLSPSPSTPVRDTTTEMLLAGSGRRRSPSPIVSRTSSTSTLTVPKRAVSTERKSPSTPALRPSPSPSTPVQDTIIEMPLASSGQRRSTSPIASRTSSTSTVSVPKRAISTERKHPSSSSLRPSPSLSTPVQDTSIEMLSASSGQRRSPSPTASRASSASTVSVPKRAISTERKRPSSPSLRSSPSPSTPVQDTTAEMLLASRKTASNKLPESLWPSTMRNLSVSFQSDTISVPVGNREKPISPTPSDRTLRPSSNVALKGETPSSGKLTSERKRSPLKGKNSADQLENSKPVDSLNARLRDQHRWPSTTSGKISNSLNRCDITDKMSKISSLSHTKMDARSIRRLSLDALSKPLHKSASDLLMLVSFDDSGKEISYGSILDDVSLRRPGSSSSSDRTSLLNAARAQLLSPKSRTPSPSVSRGISQSRSKAVNPPSRGSSPTRVRPSSPSRQPQNSASILSFIADIKDGKNAENVEDVHQLRLLYNRHLQWQYTNARTDAALHSQKVKAEKMLYNVWRTIADLWDSVEEKRSELQQLRLKLKLYSVLDNQLTFLDEWASVERDHTNSLTWTIQDLQASTLRIPAAGGARADAKTVKVALCSAVDVMQALGSSLSSILPQVEGISCLVSELANLAALERAMLDECESILGSTAALQVEEYSLRTHLLQMKQSWSNGEPAVFGY